MSAKRLTPRGVILPLLALGLLAAGCATTSSQSAQYKPHKPQMITANGAEEVGDCPVGKTFSNGIKLPDAWANTLIVMGPAFQILGQLLACH